MQRAVRHSGVCTGCPEVIFAALILVAVIVASRWAATGASVAAILVKSVPPSQSQALASPLESLDIHFSLASVWDYCWMNAEYFHGKPALADASRTTLTGFSKAVTPGELVVWRVATADADGRPLSHGGDSLHVMIKGPALLRAKVYDLRNGTYIAAFSPTDEGDYAAEVTLRWRACKAYAFCSVADTHQPIDTVKSLTFTVTSASGRGNQGEKTKKAATSTFLAAERMGVFGRWIATPKGMLPQLHPLLRDEYLWQPFRESLQPFPTSRLRGRWVYLVGDSLSEHAFSEMLEGVFDTSVCGQGKGDRVHQLVDRYNGKRMAEPWKRDGMRFFYCRPLDLLMTFVFYPDSFPVGGFRTTRFPLVNESDNSIAEAKNVTFKVAEWTKYLKQEMRRRPSVPNHDDPHAVIFNFGLHYTTPFDPPLFQVLLRHMLMALRSHFPRPTPILWRSIAHTHFEQEELAVKWNCRTPVRTEIQNEVAGRLAGALGVETLDFEGLTAARGDATADNRHFTLGTVRATYNNMLLNRLHELFGSGADNERQSKSSGSKNNKEDPGERWPRL